MRRNRGILTATVSHVEGLADLMCVGLDFPMVLHKSRTNRWELTWPSVWTLIAAKDRVFPDPFSLRYRIDLNVGEIEASLASICAQKEAARIGGGMANISPWSSGNRGSIAGN